MSERLIAQEPQGSEPNAAAPDAAARWHALEVEDTLRELESAPSGLEADEAARRLEKYGPNELEFQASRPWWRTLLKQFASPVIIILMAASVISLVQQHLIDSAAIFAVLLLNATLGFSQERKAERDVRALQSLSTPSCRIVRGGVERRIAAGEVVPGDVLLLESGERVAADLRLLEAVSLRVDESMLTGESVAATKGTDPVGADATAGDKRSIAFSGTFVASGRGRGVVIATGGRTELGSINELIQGEGSVSPLQILTHSLEKRIGLIVLVATVFVFVAGLLVGNSVGDMFRTAVALAVATIPESLPIILTVAMSVGVSRMAKRHAIVRNLPSVETLGSTNVIASDKTGTLTQNRLTVERIWTAEATIDLSDEADDADRIVPGAELSPLLRRLLRTGALTNEAAPAGDDDELSGDAVDVAMASVALELGAVTAEERAAETAAHMPYEPELAFSQTVTSGDDGTRILHVKGSPEALLRMSSALATAAADDDLDEDAVHAANEEMARAGLRVIASGARELAADEELDEELPEPSGLVFLGLQGMADPPRPGVAGAIADCKSAGIAVKMVTGDHPSTASAIAERLGLESEAEPLTGAEMAGIDDTILAARLEQTAVAARVTPQDKLRIVRVLQKAKKTVAVTGDGVNDAPALKAAAIGVAMGRSGTDVAREASDLILTDDNFVTIVDAVRQGRVTFAAIRKATYFLLSTGAAALIAVSISVLLDQPLLFLPLQMLWINIVTNGVQDIALTVEPAEGDELRRPPRARSEGILSRTLWFRLLITGTWMAMIVLVTFRLAIESGLDETHARSVALTTFVMLNFFQVGSSRAEYKSLFQLNPLANKPLLFTSLGALGLHWAVMAWPVSAGVLGVVPIGLSEWAYAAVAGSTVLALVEAEKLVRRIATARAARRRQVSPETGRIPLP